MVRRRERSRPVWRHDRPAGVRAVMDAVRDGASGLVCCRWVVMNSWGWLSRVSRLSRAERDDATDRVIWRNTDRDSIAGHDFDTEAAHPAAQLRENLMAGVALDTIQPARMNSDDGALHIDKIIFAQ